MQYSIINLEESGNAVVLTLSPVTKNRATQFLYKLFDEFEIDEETQVASIIYSKNQADEKLMDKIAINFKEIDVAISFADKCEQLSQNNLEDCVVLSVNGPNTRQNSHEDDNFDDSVSAVVELNKNNSTKVHPNQVIFDIRPKLIDPIIDLELILLYVQNKKRSGGGDIKEYNLENNNSTLSVIFEDPNSKKLILQRNTLVAPLRYMLYPRDPLIQDTSHLIEKHMLIFKNIKLPTDETVLQMYIENLVQDNDIISHVQSKIFKDTIYVKFLKEIDFKRVKERHERRPKLKDTFIEVFQAFKTNSIVSILSTFDKQSSHDLLDLHFTNPKRSASDSYISLEQKGPFIIVKFEDEEKRNKVLSKKDQKIGKAELILEQLYNEELLDSCIRRETDKEFDDIVVIPDYKYELDTKYSNLALILAKCKKIKENFKDFLKAEHLRLEGNFIQVDENTNEYPISVEMFNNQVDNCLRHFSDRIQFDIYKLSNKFPIKQEFIEYIQKVCNEINTKYEFNFLNLNEKCDEIEIHGYVQDFPNIIEELNSKDLNKLSVKSKPKEESFEFILKIDTSRLIDEHFTELLQELTNKYDAMIEGIKDGLQVTRCDSKKDIDSIKWRKQIEDYVKEFMSKLQTMPSTSENNTPIALPNELVNIQLNEARMLFTLKYKSDMEKRFSNMKVKIDMKLRKIVYESNDQSDIEKAKSYALDLFSKIKSKIFKCERLRLEFLLHNEIELVKWIGETGLQCVIDLKSEFNNQAFVIYALNDDVIQQCYDLFSDYIIIIEFRIAQNKLFRVNQFVSKFNSNLIWNGKAKESQFKMDFNQDKTIIFIAGFKESAEKLNQELCNFVYE